MSDAIKVHVIDYGKDRSLMMRYRCPVTGKQVARSTGTRNPKKAIQAAAVWQDELQSGRYQKPTHMAWDVFREYYVTNALPGLAERSQGTYESVLNVFERLCNPQRLADVTTARITGFVTSLRAAGKSESTVACHLRHLKAAMRWAHKQGLLSTLPVFTMPKRAKGAKVMRGRPITAEEFDRMLEAVPKAVENAAADSWRFYLQGLWASGLRLTESLNLRWDDAPKALVVDLTGRRPMLRIPAEAHKAGRDTLLPMTPDFAQLLESVPERERRGRVFKLLDIDSSPLRGGRGAAGKVVSAIGQAAGVVVNDEGKYASAHDLRRAFGLRWSRLVMPTVLKELMRHEDVSTTMKYYVGQNAETTADAIWAAVGNTLGNTHLPAKTPVSKSPLFSSTGERT